MSSLLYISDAVLHPLHLEYPDWCTDFYDIDIVQAAVSKKTSVRPGGGSKERWYWPSTSTPSRAWAMSSVKMQGGVGNHWSEFSKT